MARHKPVRWTHCDEPFALTNPPPKRKKLDVPNTTGIQKVLLAGLDSEPDQKFLFNSNGDKAHDDAR
jgi:hypothetical protein